MGGASSEEGLLLQIQCLVSDSLRVVSYKWLSRNFSISSNAAKRLLQKFVKQNNDHELAVVYAISGWTKKEPNSYAIQLVPNSRLQEVKDTLKEAPSVHVYSVQRCLPKDPAQLWSVDFVQAERLFNEAADIDNCLRDNRFSAVTCTLVHRSSTKNPRVTSAFQPRTPVSNGPAIVPCSATSDSKLKVPAPLVEKSGKDGKDAAGEKKPAQVLISAGTDVRDAAGAKKPTSSSISPKTPHTEPKDSLGHGSTGKRKTPAATGGSGGSSLASMWGKAPAKPKAPSPAKPSAVAASPPLPPVPAGDAEARILAMEEEASSEEDMASEFASLKRGHLSSSAGRRRRMIVDDDSGVEDDDSETIVRLGTPDSQERKSAATAARGTLAREEVAPSVHEKLSNPKETCEVDDKMPSKPDSNPEIKGKWVAEEKPAPVIHLPDASKGGSKRKKVLKTRIDERGREVTEITWEIDGGKKELVDDEITLAAKLAASSSKQTDAKPCSERPLAIQKPATAPPKSTGNKASSKASAKSASKLDKGQGNIMSFFKKT